jgi:hypothetical protein
MGRVDNAGALLTVTQRTAQGSGSRAGFVRGVVLAAVGCGNPEQGTVKLPPQSHERLAPHLGPQGKDSQKQSVEGKTIGIKGRAPSAPPPVKSTPAP